MIIYLVEPGLDSQQLSLLASFKDFFLVAQFLNFLTTPRGKKPWASPNSVSYNLNQISNNRADNVQALICVQGSQHGPTASCSVPILAAYKLCQRTCGSRMHPNLSLHKPSLFQSLESLIIFQITP